MNLNRIAKYGSVIVIALVAITALGPVGWQPRTSLGWEFDHVLGYFVITLLVCFAWPRPIIAGGALLVFAALLEWLQSFTPAHSPNLMAVVYSAGGVLMAGLLAELFIRARRRAAIRR
jgi:VanZ family protein